jgi:phage replication O-like protein O
MATVAFEGGQLMANPQAENGHIDIANELGEAFARLYLSAGESRILWAILRKTYGWHKKFDRISFTQFERLTGMDRRYIADALSKLIKRRIVVRRGNKHKLEYALNKDYDQWQSLPMETMNQAKHLRSLPKETTKEIVAHGDNTPLSVQTTNSLSPEANTKEKRKYTKENTAAVVANINNNQSFDQFVDELRAEYKDIDFDLELKKLNDLLHDQGKKPKSPRLTLRRWMQRAREYNKNERDVGRAHRRNSEETSSARLYSQ